ncbi:MULTISPECIES: MFS transporter [Deefgea]|uniref:MFS transporter n=1 Tax=Deefgea chitinilytica TaxID=570276 RepID=A0ABS2CBN5_9NEIS|nr:MULTISPECIES: MFS transporter [Deefgea]MBM5570771.1 MFS transporter [Deefgea chitinilytica]MBM9888000.1 MFS transporter [Deefgea sp. CFH1-16]
MHKPNQFDLFRQQRFLPLFLTQFSGAFNDNLFKNAFLVLIAFHGLSTAGLNAATLVNMAAGVFILPFFLFSTLAGQLAEKYDKATLAQWIKLLEIAIMIVAGIGFIWHSAALLMSCLFLMGVHSALFGPLKYSVLPQYLQENEILGGNGLIEMGTFIAILLGQIAGTLLVQHQPHGETLVVWACVAVAILGYCFSRAMPSAPPTAPDLKIGWNIFSETSKILSHVRKNKTVFNSLLGISWFWFFGSIYLTQFPNFAKDTLHGDATVYTLLMTIFSLGVGIGSVLCEKLSDSKVELGLVPFGSIGLSIFAIDLFFASANLAGTLQTAQSFLMAASHWRIIIDLFLIGVFGGIFIVPLYALIQIRTEREFTSRAIAANNILNSFFMVIAAGMSIVLLNAGLTVRELLLVAGILNIFVAIYIYTLIPEFLMRFIVWILTHTLYRIQKTGFEHIPEQGAVVLACNHVSFMDAMVLAGAIRRPIRFVMDHQIYNLPVMNFICRTANAIPIAPTKESAEMKDSAFAAIAQALENGEVVAIFPEGRITRTGEINRFMPGIERIIRTTPVPVVPMALQGLWGSFFSRKDGAAMMKMPRGIFSKIGIVVGEPIAASNVNRQDLENTIRQLRGDWK